MPKAHSVQTIPPKLLPVERIVRTIPQKLKPLSDCVLIEEEKFESYDKHIGLQHIVVPDKYEHGPKDRNPWGKVIAIGPECKKWVKVDQRVTWGKWSGARYDYKEKVLVLVREMDILAYDDQS